MKKLITKLFQIVILILPLSIVAQNQVEGTIKSASGDPIIGANVKVLNSDVGTVTDVNGNFSLEVPSGDVELVCSYVGFGTQTISVNNRSKLDIVMSEDVNLLEDVFITATSKPTRKMETVTAVEAISAREIERMNPVSLADLVRLTPGIYVQTQAGRVRNFIFTRGFPDATNNGLVYTSLMMDGVRTFASPEMVPDAAFRQDLNIGKVEVVRGSAATLYGRGAAAGAINVISRTGGTETAGTVKATYGQYNWLQLDANINGSLTANKAWRYNVGGFLLSDDGFRENLFPDRGGQLRANVDYLVPNSKSKIRIYGGLINLNVQNMISIPYAANDLTKPAGNWTTRMIELKEGNPFEGSGWPITNPASGVMAQNDYDPAYADGNFSRGFNIGSNFDIDLGNDLVLSNKIRFQKMKVGIAFDFSIAQNFGDTQTKLLFGGGGTDGGSDSQDIIEELRLVKSFGDHSITLGGYFSTINVKVESAGTFYSQNTADPANPIYNREPFGFPFNLNFRGGDYDETTTSGFLGYDGKFNDKLTIQAGLRFDNVNLDLTDNYQAGQENLNVNHDHKGTSASIGFNYLLTPLSAIYGNFNSTFRAPDYSTYTPVRYLSDTTIIDKPFVEDNEKVTSFEIGFRKSTGDWSLDAGVFSTAITNRTVASFVGAIATQVPVGDNNITGAEISLIYTPQETKGLYARTSLTYQGSKYSSYMRTSPDGPVELEGKNLANVAPIIWNVSLGYDKGKIGFNLNTNYLAARPIDVYNTADYPARMLIDANLSFSVTSNAKIRIGGQNLSNVSHASSVVSAQTDDAFYLADANSYSGDFRHVRGVPLLPRRIFGSIEYKF